MEASVDRGKRINNSWPEHPSQRERSYPDALADENVYRVVGKATNAAERTASQDLSTGRFSDARHVRLRLFQWPGESGSGLLAVLQYDFPGVNPAGSCWSIGLLVRLVKNAATWEPRDKYLLDTVHHSSLQRIELLDLAGNGGNELVIESNFGGAGTVGSGLQVFDLSHGRIEEVLHENSRLEYMEEEGYSQVLDIERTRQDHAQRFCVTKTALFEKGEWFNPPRISHPCYKRGDGIDQDEVNLCKEMLAPLR
jgi:hypothetical protein